MAIEEVKVTIMNKEKEFVVYDMRGDLEKEVANDNWRGVILFAHLHLEKMLEQLLIDHFFFHDERLDEFYKYFIKDLGFEKKRSMLKGLKLIEEDESVQLRELNEKRKNVAHRLDQEMPKGSKIEGKELEDFIGKYCRLYARLIERLGKDDR